MCVMEQIKLLSPCREFTQDIALFRDEILAAKDSDAFAGCCTLGRYASIPQWLDMLTQFQREETCPDGFVTSNVYLAVRCSDSKIVGMIDLRHHINHPILGLWGGHIGYSVRPSERRKGYAKEMLRQLLQICAARNMDRVMITCHPENTASEKTILANGGVFEKQINVEGKAVKRYWITL